jgi:hypothetical protein
MRWHPGSGRGIVTIADGFTEASASGTNTTNADPIIRLRHIHGMGNMAQQSHFQYAGK